MATIIDAYPVGHPRHYDTNGSIPLRIEYIDEEHGYRFITVPLANTSKVNASLAAFFEHECKMVVMPAIIKSGTHARVTHQGTDPLNPNRTLVVIQ